MIPDTRFEQTHGITASKLSHALKLLDNGNLEEARSVLIDVQRTNQEQAMVIDARVYAAVRHICESRGLDSRRFFAMQQVLGLREIARTLMMTPNVDDLIAMHLPIENDFFVTLLSHIPMSSDLRPLAIDDFKHFKGEYQNGNARLWSQFCAQQALNEEVVTE